jgi:hypothetical protein
MPGAALRPQRPGPGHTAREHCRRDDKRKAGLISVKRPSAHDLAPAAGDRATASLADRHHPRRRTAAPAPRPIYGAGLTRARAWFSLLLVQGLRAGLADPKTENHATTAPRSGIGAGSVGRRRHRGGQHPGMPARRGNQYAVRARTRLPWQPAGPGGPRLRVPRR